MGCRQRCRLTPNGGMPIYAGCVMLEREFVRVFGFPRSPHFPMLRQRPELDVDYGVPLGPAERTGPYSWRRNLTRSYVSLTRNEYALRGGAFALALCFPNGVSHCRSLLTCPRPATGQCGFCDHRCPIWLAALHALLRA